jgi:FkbM family methyltransferase
MANLINELLNELNITPVLMDVGASGEPPAIWNDLAENSIYIGFDPDLREIHEDRVAGYRRSIIVNEAVAGAKDAGALEFYLTRSPFCSTSLPPDPAAASHWIESNRFEVENRTTVRATTVDDVLKRLGMPPRIDWFKIDSQGIDLRVINSIPPDVLARVMAIDTEPGLIAMYQQEDMFVDVHRDLTSRGFWLSSMKTGEFVRMRRSTLDGARAMQPDIDEAYMRSVVRKTPAYFEARYLRTLEWLADMSLSQQEYVLLWIFALIDGQYGFALDLNIEFERRFGADGVSRQLAAATWLRIKTARHRHNMRRAAALVARPVLAMLRDLYSPNGVVARLQNYVEVVRAVSQRRSVRIPVGRR